VPADPTTTPDPTPDPTPTPTPTPAPGSVAGSDPDTVPAPATTSIVLGPLRANDLDGAHGVLAVERAVFSHPWSRRIFTEELAQRRSRIYRAAWDGRRVVAYAGLMLIDDEAHVNNIAVHPMWQRRSIATVLLLDAVRQARARGTRHLTLEVRVGNDGAVELYRRFGFAPVGIRPNYYPETGDDALIMWARDIDSDDYSSRIATIGAALPPSLSVTW